MQMTSIEHSYRAIADTIGQSGLGIIIAQNSNDEETIVFCNDRVQTILGYEHEELIGKSIWDIVPQSRGHKTNEMTINRQESQIIPFQHEVALVRRDGSSIPLEISASYMELDGRRATLVLINDITERKKTEKKYRQLLDDMNEGYVVVQDGKYVFSNSRFAEIFGYRPEQVTGRSLGEFLTSDYRQLVKDLYEKMTIRQETSVQQVEVMGIKQDGTEILVEADIRAIEYEGKPAFTTIVRDITERKQHEIALRESEERFLTAFRKNPSAMAISTLSEGRIIDANESFLQMVEYSREDLIGCTTDEIGFFGELGGRSQALQKILNGSNQIDTEKEIVIRTKTGKHHKIIGSAKVVSINGQPHLISMARDITEQEETEEKYRQLVENMSDGYGVLIDGKFAFTNSRLCEIFGCSPKQMRELSIYDFSIPENRYDAENMFKSIMRGNQEAPEWREGRAIKKDGTEISLEIGSRILPYEDKLGLYIIVRDVTERKLIEKERQKVDKLESIGMLAGGIAHDFNNLLTGIMGNISLAKIYLDPKNEVAQRLEEAEKASVRAKDLTQQLLTFSRAGAPVKKQITLPDLIKEAATFILHGSNVKPAFSIEEDLWSIEADEGQICQVIYNVVKNASEAMPEGGIVEIRTKNTTIKKTSPLPLDPGEYVEIRVKDTGTGIRKKDIDKIFDPYFSTKQRGSGLGLTTVYSIIKNHGGHITLNSKLGSGTTFHIYLPALKKQIQRKEENVKEALQPAFIGQGRILVMDDTEIVRILLSRILQKAGYEVEVTLDGAEAIEQYIKTRESGTPFDAVIMDLTVPGGMGGKEAITKLLEIDPGVKAIVSSGYANDPIMAEYEKYGFSAVVAKPYNADEITSALDGLLNSKNKS